MPRGRPPSVGNSSVIQAILNHKNDIICDNAIAVELDPVWSTISKELLSNVKPSSLYSYVVNNRFGLKNLLFGTDENENVSSNETRNFNPLNKLNRSFEQAKTDLGFILTLSKNEFDDLIMETQRQSRDKNGNLRFRIINILKPKKWTEEIAKKIYEEFRLTHGYHFENSYISGDKTSGAFRGHCRCGSKLTCELLPRTDDEQLVKIKCVASPGNGDCGKRQCRGESRKRVAAVLEGESTESYRAKYASKIMNEEDMIEPPHLYSANVLRMVKYESQQKNYRNSDPIRAIAEFKKSGGRTIIRDIGFDPFMVHFWSPHQIRLYNKFIKTKECFLCIDATGGIGKRVFHVDGSKSQHIFLYLAVVSSPNADFAACEMLSEHQDTVSISTWLMKWIQSGAECPKEVVCDSSKALLNACCITFASYQNIGCYAEACMSGMMPRTKIGIDAAHYINNWAKSLAQEKKVVKKFYMFCIGQLIICRSQEQATRIIEALLLISSSETAGTGCPSLTAAVNSMKSMITEITPEMEEIVEQSLSNNENENFHTGCEVEEHENENENILGKWISIMEKKVVSIVENETGDDINPRYSPTFSKRLVKQLPTIPLWSSICRDQFGYGRVPASSASVELQFKTLKNQVLINEKRVDLALENIVEYYNGKLKIINCADNQKELIDRRENKQLSQQDESRPLDVDTDISDIDECSLEESNFSQEKGIPLQLADTEDITFEKPLLKSGYNKENEKKDSIWERYKSTERTPLKALSSTNNSEIARCLACSIGNYPSGGHVCANCGKKVHLLEGCSVAIDGEEEGYGEKRHCIPCSRMSTIEMRTALNEVENWRGLGNEAKIKKKGNTYLTKTNQDLNDVILSEKTRKLPILKNGNDQTLGLVTFKLAQYSVTNTCSLDSMFQIFLAAVTDNDKILKYVENNRKKNPLFEMVVGVARSKITQSTYKKRLEIFLNYTNQTKESHRFKTSSRAACQDTYIESIEGGCNIVSLANFLFKNCASFQERSTCDAGCPPRIKFLPTLTITEKEMKQSLRKVLRDHLILPSVCCPTKDCNGTEENEIQKIEDIVVIGVDMEVSTAIGTIPKSFCCPTTQAAYTILGVVEYRGPPASRSQSAMGHYIAITRRQLNWVAYDDTKKKSYLVFENSLLKVELLVYSKL